MRNRHLKPLELLSVLVCLFGILSARSLWASCSCDPEQPIVFKLHGDAVMWGSATITITYGSTVQTTTISAPNTATWNGSQWVLSPDPECVKWQSQITVSPTVDQPVLIQYSFNSNPNNPAQYAQFADENGAPNPVIVWSRPSLPCLHVWIDENDENWVEDPIVLVADPGVVAFRVKGVITQDDSSVGDFIDLQAGGGEPPLPNCQLSDTADIDPQTDLTCPGIGGPPNKPLKLGKSKSGLGIRPATTLNLKANKSIGSESFKSLQKGSSIAARPENGPSGGNGYSISDPIGRLRWVMSLGSQSRTFTLGHLVYQANTLDSTAYLPATLSLQDGSDPAQVITDANGLRQVSLQNQGGLVDIELLSDGFEVDVYPQAQVTGFNGTLFTFTGSPSVTWKVENPDNPTAAGRVQFTQIQNGTTYVHMAQWQGTAGSAGTMTINRFNNKWTEATQYSLNSNPNQRVELVSRYKNGVLQNQTRNVYQEFDSWGNTGDVFDALVERDQDPNGQDLVTTLGYYSTQPLLGQEIDPDGYQVTYPNRLASTGGQPPLVAGGTALQTLEPLGDNLNEMEEDFSYTVNSPSSLTTTTEQFADGQVVGYQQKFEQVMNGIWYTGIYKTVDETGTYSYEEQDVEFGSFRPVFFEDAQGRTRNISHTPGFWDSGSQTFNESGIGVLAVETITVNGTVNVLNGQNGIANETTIDLTVEDQNGHLFLEQSYVSDGTGNIIPANLITQTVHIYNSDGRETARYLNQQPNPIYQATYYPNGLLESELDESGRETDYTYDELLRVYQKTIRGREGDEDQVITYDYDVLGNITSEVRTAGGITAGTQWTYNLAGDLTSITTQDGLTTQYSTTYSGGKTVTETLPTQATKITAHLFDRSVYSVTGTAVESEYQVPALFQWNNDGFYRLGREFFRDSAHNEFKSLQLNNWAGDEVLSETPEFGGANNRQRYTIYDLDNSSPPQSSRLPVEIEDTGVANQLLTYDDLARLASRGYDLVGDGNLDPSSIDPITTYTRQFDHSSGSWEDVSSVQQYKQDNSSTETLVLQTSILVPAALAPNEISHQTNELADGGLTLTTVTLDPTTGEYTTTVNDEEHNHVSTSVLRDDLLRSDTRPGITSLRTYGYTALGEIQTINDPVAGSMTYAYDPTTRQLLSASDSLSHETQNTYYPAGSINAGKLSGQKDAAQNWTYFDYYPTGQQYRKWGVNIYPVQYQYDPAGNMTQITTYRTAPGTVNWASSTWPNPPGGDTTQWLYDTPSQLLQSKTYPDGGSGQKTVSYTYNSADILQTKVNGRGQTATYGFDTIGRLKTITYSDGTPSVTLGYDRGGRLVSCTDAAGTHSVTWTDRDQMENETYTAGLLNGIGVNRAYDPQFRLQQLQFQQSSAVQTFEQFNYDTISRVNYISEMNASGTTELRRYTYGYATGLPFVQSVASSQPVGTTVVTQNYTHDGLGRLYGANVTLGGGTTPYGVNYQFDSLNRRFESDLADGTKWTYGYDNRSEVTSGGRVLASGAHGGGKQYAYTFDDIGNRLTASFGGDATGANLSQSTYGTANALNEQTTRTVPAAVWLTGDAPNTLTLLGAANGQAFTVQQQENNQFFADAPAANSSAPVYVRTTVAGKNGSTLADFQTGHKFVAKTPENFTYDADGNLTQDGQWNYTWDAESRLIKMVSATTVGPQQQIDFSYDWMGRRISKTVWNNIAGSGTPALSELFVYDRWNLIAILNSSSTLLQTFMWGLDLSGSPYGAGGVGGALSMTLPNGAQAGTYFYGYDGNGNVMELVKTDQSIAAQYEYGPFGEVIGTTGALAQTNPFCFSTKFQDNESGLSYYGYRYYNSSTGKWLGRDRLQEAWGINLQEFSMNDGVNSIDDTGLGSIYIVNANGQQTLLYTPPPAPTGLLAKMKSLIFGNGNAPVKAPDNCGCCDKLKKLLGQAYLADDVYTDNSTGEENVPNAPNYMRLSNQQLQQLGIDPSMMVDNKIGFYSALYYNRMDQTYSIAYRGTHNLANWKSNVKQGLGFPEPAYLDAAQLGTLLGNLFPGKICGIGHSLGGGENSVSSLSGHFPGVNFNPAGVSPITAARLGIPTGGIYVNFGINPALAKLAGVNLVDADKYITAYSVPGDILSQGVNFMPGVPGTDGQQVLLDSPGTLPLGIDRHLMGNVEAAIQREMAEHGCQ